MKIKALFAAIFCLFFHAASAFALDQGNQPQGVVAYCFDGDTIKLKDRRIVRLAGIDAPETAHKDQPAQFYSRQARNYLESLVRGKTVRLEFPGLSGKDRHGRLIANVLLEDGASVNELMLEGGAAFFYPHQDLGPDFQQRLKEIQAGAIKERRGLWKTLLDLPLAADSYVGNRNSLRFFPDSCPAAQRLKPRNRENFGTLMDAFLAGFAPARVCIFWPQEKKQPR